jgi:hypothetical protein
MGMPEAAQRDGDIQMPQLHYGMTGITCDFNSATVNGHACYTAFTGDNFQQVHSSLQDKGTYHILIRSSGFTAGTPQRYLLSHSKFPTKQCEILQPSFTEATPTFAQNGAITFVKNFWEPYCDDTRNYVTMHGLVKVSNDTAHSSTFFCMPARNHQLRHL